MRKWLKRRVTALVAQGWPTPLWSFELIFIAFDPSLHRGAV
jgi:hypothetical protein